MSASTHQPEVEQEAVDRLVARANAYSLLSMALEPPASWDARLIENLRREFQALGPELQRLAESLANSMESALSDREPVDVAFAKLFLGPFEIEAPPYASLYLDPEGRLMGPVSLSVAESYAEAGLGPAANGPREVPDHITHELEFMYFLAFEEAKTGHPIWRERASRFWNTHLGDWLPDFATRLAQASRHGFYDMLAALLTRFAQEERALHTQSTN